MHDMSSSVPVHRMLIGACNTIVRLHRLGGGGGVYTDFVMTSGRGGQSRLIRSSSPFGLYSSGVHTLSGLPNGEKLIDIPLVSENTTAAMNSPRPAGAEQHGSVDEGSRKIERGRRKRRFCDALSHHVSHRAPTTASF